MTDTGLDIYGHLEDDEEKKPLKRYAPTVHKQDEFIRRYSENGFSIRATCAAMGLTTSAYYHWLKRDPEFAQRMFDYQLDLASESEAVVRAGVYGNLDIDDYKKVDIALGVLRLMKQTSINVTTNKEGGIDGININFIN